MITFKQFLSEDAYALDSVKSRIREILQNGYHHNSRVTCWNAAAINARNNPELASEFLFYGNKTDNRVDHVVLIDKNGHPMTGGKWQGGSMSDDKSGFITPAGTYDLVDRMKV